MFSRCLCQFNLPSVFLVFSSCCTLLFFPQFSIPFPSQDYLLLVNNLEKLIRLSFLRLLTLVSVLQIFFPRALLICCSFGFSFIFISPLFLISQTSYLLSLFLSSLSSIHHLFNLRLFFLPWMLNLLSLVSSFILIFSLTFSPTHLLLLFQMNSILCPLYFSFIKLFFQLFRFSFMLLYHGCSEQLLSKKKVFWS